MKKIIFALMLLTGCGSDDSGDNAQQEPAPATGIVIEITTPANA